MRDRGHFFAVAARAMRQVLMDAAREAMADKRGGRMAGVTLEGQDLAMPRRTERLLALDEALARLAEMDARQAQVVEYRFFAGLSVEEMAEVLGVSVGAVRVMAQSTLPHLRPLESGWSPAVKRDWASRAPGSPARWAHESGR